MGAWAAGAPSYRCCVRLQYRLLSLRLLTPSLRHEHAEYAPLYGPISQCELLVRRAAKHGGKRIQFVPTHYWCALRAHARATHGVAPPHLPACLPAPGMAAPAHAPTAAT